LNAPPSTEYRTVNRAAWNSLARAGCDSSRPLTPEELAAAHEWLCPDDWLPWGEIRSVLCVASGGGQQAPAFAVLGYDVVVADISAEQLARDRATADDLGVELECVEADMLDLSPLYGRRFDLVYQAISSCYVPNVPRLYTEIARVLAPGGWYDVEHWNPTHVQLMGLGEWDGGAYTIERSQDESAPSVWTGGTDEHPDEEICCWHYAHPLHHLIGGLGRAGFTIHRLVERPDGVLDAPPGSHEHLAAFVPPFLRIVARLRAR
jgi:SAM-dependent methyltransferase